MAGPRTRLDLLWGVLPPIGGKHRGSSPDVMHSGMTRAPYPEPDLYTLHIQEREGHRCPSAVMLACGAHDLPPFRRGVVGHAQVISILGSWHSTTNRNQYLVSGRCPSTPSLDRRGWHAQVTR